jgi:alpha-N-acetylglucosaminidase
MDPFNELVPPSNDPAYLARVSSSIYAAATAADPHAIWVLQGWFLIANQAFWFVALTCP